MSLKDDLFGKLSDEERAATRLRQVSESILDRAERDAVSLDEATAETILMGVSLVMMGGKPDMRTCMIPILECLGGYREILVRQATRIQQQKTKET